MDLVAFKSFLSWQGSKARMLKSLSPYFPDSCRCYYEPFLGSGAVALAIAPRCSEMVLSDKNSCLINAWQCVRENPEAIEAALHQHKHQHDRSGSAAYFDYVRELYNDKKGSGPEAAARFIYLNKACFNGLWRANAQGRINMPVGDTCHVPKLTPIADRIFNAAIVHSGFSIIENAQAGDLIYLDPPYYEGHRKIASGYGVGRFTDDDRTTLARLASDAANRGAIVVGSDLDCPHTRALYQSAGFTCESVDFTYSIGGKSKTRKISSELIYISQV